MVLVRGTAIGSTTVAILLLLQPVSVVGETVVDVGGSQTETTTLGAGDWRGYRATLGFLESLRIEVTVLQGGLIDLFTTNDLGFDQYRDPNSTVFSYYPAASRINVTSFSDTFAPPTTGEYFVIVDNARITSGGATPTGPATVAVAIEKGSLVPVVVGILVVLAAVALGTIWLVRSRRRKRVASRPPKAETRPPP